MASKHNYTYVKKHYYTFSIFAVVIVLANPALTHAQSTNVDANVRIPVNSGTIHTNVRTLDNSGQVNTNIQKPEHSGSTNTNTSVNVSTFVPTRLPTMRERILNDNQIRMDNMRTNQSYRNGLLGERTNGMFQIRKENITKQLRTALENLMAIRQRVNSRIEKERVNGVDMTKAVSLLSIADAKLKSANDAITALNAYASHGSTNVPTSMTVDLDAARQIVVVAQKAIHDAQMSLKAVIDTL